MRMLILCVWLTWQPFFIEMAGQKGKRTCCGMLHYVLYTHKTDIPSEHRGDFESAVLKRVEKWKWYEDDSITSTSYGRPSQNKRAAPTQLAGAPRYYCNSQTKQAGWKCGASLLNIWLGQGCRAARLPIGFTATFQDWWCVRALSFDCWSTSMVGIIFSSPAIYIDFGNWPGTVWCVLDLVGRAALFCQTMWEHPAEVLLPGHFLKLKSADRRAQLSDAPAKSFGEKQPFLPVYRWGPSL